MQYKGLVYAKALCVLVMVYVHSVVLFFLADGWAIETARPFAYLLVDLRFLGLFSFSIPFIAGAIYYVSRRSGGFWIGVGLLISGYVMNAIAWGMDQFYWWDVLHTIGFGFIVLSLFPFTYRSTAAGLLGVAAVGLTFFIREALLPYSGGYVPAVLVGGDVYTFGWPVFPWVSLVFFGYASAALLARFSSNKQKLVLLCAAVLLYFALLGLGYGLPVVDYASIWGPSMFQSSVLFVLSYALFALSMLLVLDFLPWNPPFFIRRISESILFVYAIHVVLVAWLSSVLWNFVAMAPQSPNEIATFGIALAIVPVLIILVSVVSAIGITSVLRAKKLVIRFYR